MEKKKRKWHCSFPHMSIFIHWFEDSRVVYLEITKKKDSNPVYLKFKYNTDCQIRASFDKRNYEISWTESFIREREVLQAARPSTVRARGSHVSRCTLLADIHPWPALLTVLSCKENVCMNSNRSFIKHTNSLWLKLWSPGSEWGIRSFLFLSSCGW